MTRFAGPLTFLALAAAIPACTQEGATTGGATNETPEETPTPSATPTSTGTPNPQGKEVRFVAIGDTGAGYDQQYPVAAAINQKCQEDGCDFGMLLGDNFYDSGVESPTDEQFYTKFEQPYGGLEFPFFIVLGNHDYGGGGTGHEFDKGLHQVSYAQTNPQFVLPAEYYSFEEEPATFLALGTNLIFWDYGDSIADQAEYFSQILEGTQQPWKIAFGHHPYLSNGKHGNAGEYDSLGGIDIFANGKHVKSFFDDHLCGRVDLYLSGHDHSRQILPGTTACPTTFVVSGAGAKTTELPGSGPNLFQADTKGFAYVVVSDEKIVIQMLDMSGALEYEHTIYPQ